ncbi:LuxR C-terminal-related transcriptional regulator [Chitinophaga nivalis]|uniref:LuxR C-terminal-related transcriptional regulator n=1 Tax=Chitinophaga nivalis TaxID=2991709 RepID=A0ABT3IW42_9BACT|nr:LuxR C-terminal-related transcriptional regulator [Chitinophaga nivalis]MCW3462102.1 LuxR C-terminal-related transcriptional regulator [Chitinophaga nivalis]MCW3488206.1 LuxR C-terminal-related transcriptional regulator [Chitinophaga nivalis]
MQTGSDLGQNISLSTLQKENEQLKNRVNWLESILHHVPAMVYSYDNNTKTVTWCNDCLAETVGFSPEEMKGMGIDFFRDIMHPDDFKLAAVAQQSFINNKSQFGGLARIRKRGETEYRWLIGLEVPFTHDKNGRVVEIICAFLDLTNAIDTNLQLSAALSEILRRQNETLFNKLTAREKDVLGLAVQGLNNKEIANSLNLSRYTVETHRKNIRLKLKVRNTTELVAIARKIGFE